MQKNLFSAQREKRKSIADCSPFSSAVVFFAAAGISGPMHNDDDDGVNDIS